MTLGRAPGALACLAALVVVAAVAVGCGETDQEQAREVSQDYVDARNARDFEKICDLLAPSFIEQLGAADCPAFMEEQTAGVRDEELELVDVRVTDDVATADIDVTSESQEPIRIGLRLEQTDGEWQITGVQ